MGYFQYEGLPLSSTIHNEDVMKSIRDYDDFKPDDVILVTYPKTGSCYNALILLYFYGPSAKRLAYTLYVIII